MTSYWDISWEQIDPERLTEYIAHFDLQPDALIESLHSQNARTVCDAGCGCGIHALRLAANGFMVSGFDISAHAVEIARKLLESASCHADLKTASILSTGYCDNQFDCVISRDVIDHMCKSDGIAAVRELYRITCPGGSIIITLDSLDDEYESEPHQVSADGDYLFTDGKWKGMVFHPYSEQEIMEMIPPEASFRIDCDGGEFTVKLKKPEYAKSQHDKVSC